VKPGTREWVLVSAVSRPMTWATPIIYGQLVAPDGC
jgi:hypothetical protein